MTSLVVAALLVLANLTDELRERTYPTFPRAQDTRFEFEAGRPMSQVRMGVWGLSYGWPLLWGQYVVIESPYGGEVVGWRFSTGRLAANAALWLLMLAAPTAACELLSRRYCFRFRFSLRLMLAAVTLAAVFFGWFVWARDRSRVEDAFIDEIRAASGEVWLERWGPKWLDFLGADRYRRHIVAVNVRMPPYYQWQACERVLGGLSRSPDIRYLFLETENLTPDIAALWSACP